MKNLGSLRFLQRGTALLVCVVFVCEGARAATYYVDATGGDDFNNGTAQDRAWKTLSKVNSASLLAGDSVLFKRGEMWRGQLSLTRSGTALSSITFGAYGTGAKPLFNGSTVITGWTAAGGNLYTRATASEPDVVVFNGVNGVREAGVSALDAANEWYWENNTLTIYSASVPVNMEAADQHFVIAGNGVSHLRIQDLDVKFATDPICMNETRYVVIENVDVYDSAGLGAILIISYTAGKGEYNTVRNCTAYNIVGNAESLQSGNDGCGILLYGAMCKHNTVALSTVHDCGHEGIVVLGGSDNLIANNTVYQCSESGFRVALETAMGNVLENNHSHANAQKVDDRFGIDLIRVGDNNIARYNLVHDQHDTLNDPNIPANGGGSKYGSGGIRFDGGDWEDNDYMDSVGNKAYYNVVYNETTGFLSFNFSNIEFYNNAIYSTTATGLGIVSASATIAFNNTAKNNIIYTAAGQALVRYRATDNHIDYNRYFSAGTVTFSWASAIVDFAAWRSASQQDAHSAVENPLWVNPSGHDFHLQSSSPCIDIGIDAGLTRDYEGTPVPQRSGVDMGAFELPPPMITLGTPNGGETYATGQSVTMQWTYTDDPGANVKVELLQAGTPFVLAASVPAGTGGTGSWNWTIPLSQTAGGDYRIRVTSLDCPECTDTSNADFTITAPTISVAVPAGGETWFGGETHILHWTYTGDPGAEVRIELLNGSTPALLAASVSTGSAGSGQWAWTIPAAQSDGTAYEIRVTSNSNPYCEDTSDNSFTIHPAAITVATPNGGETWGGGEVRTLQWSYAGNPGTAVNIELVNAGTPTTLAAWIAIGVAGTGSWDWTLPSDIAAGVQYRIRVTSVTVPTCTDLSNADFTIAPAAIAVSSPNGGDTWIGGETRTLQWSYTGNPGTAVDIELLSAGVPALLAAGIAIGAGGTGSWDWAIPPATPPGSQYRIRVTSASAAACTDVSDADFAISAPVIAVITPNGGESWTAGENRQLQWSYTGNPGPTVQIELLDGVTPQVLAADVPLGSLGTGGWNWQIPFSVAGGTDYSIRVSSTGNAWCDDTSDGPFSIAAVPADTIAVVSPDNGETWTRGETRSIEWIYAGDPGSNVSIELLDAGVPSVLAASVPVGASGTGSWDWTLAASQPTGTHFRVRVSSVTKPACTDTSFGDFTIDTAAIAVDTPNGGEQWYTGETHTVQWAYTGLPGENVRIELLSGGPPQVLAASVPVGADGTGSWDWSIPAGQASGANCTVRVSSTTNPSCADSSNGTFSIVTSAITVGAPNGGEHWIGGETHAIQWTYTGNPGTDVQIEVLNGATPTVLTPSTSIGADGTGSWPWSIPSSQPAGTDYRIRISSSSIPASTDTSDASFQIDSPAIAMVAPNGGETWIGGETRTIEWTYTGNPGANVHIELLNNGTPATLAPSVSTGSGGSGSWNWTIPANQAAGPDYGIRVTGTTIPSSTGTSAANFTIAAPAMTVTNPNSGGSFETGALVNIQWSYTGNPGSNVEVAVLDGSDATVLIASTSAGSNGSGEWNWTIPLSQTPGADYRIRVTSTGLPSCTDTSDVPFTITAPALTVTAPNGGETLTAGNSYPIQWTYTGAPGANVLLELIDGGAPSVLASSVPVGSGGAGIWTWAIPAGHAIGDDFAIRIASTSNSYCTDTSDDVFTIDPPPPTVTVSTPNGGETWHAGETREIQWTYTNDPGSYVRIELLQGADVTVIGASVPIGAGGTGIWGWAIPLSQPLAANYRIRVSSIDTPACVDTSNADFSIAAGSQDTLTVVSPNGEENWLTRDSHPIVWTYTGDPGPNVRIELLRGGAVASVLVSSVSVGSGGNGSWNWSPSFFLESRSDYAIRITSTDTPSVTDTSDDVFTVNRWANIRVEFPNGGEQWIRGETRTLRWSYAGNVGNAVRVILRRGSSNTTLASGLPLGAGGHGSWSWTIPADQQPSDNYRIRLETSSFFSASDTSDGAFTIAAPTITVTSPNGGEDWKCGATREIRWTFANGPGPAVRIELLNDSVPAGLAEAVPTGESGAGSWSWTVPVQQPPGTLYRIRVTSESNTLSTDDSDDDFQISLEPPQIQGVVVEPTSAKALSGDSLQMTVYMAAGTPPFTYQWFMDGGGIPDSNAPAYVLAPALPSDSGDYTCRVANNAGSDISDPVTIRVAEPLAFSLPPQGGEYIVGDSHVFAATATGGFEPFSYEWQKEGETEPIFFGTTFDLDNLELSDSGQYCVIATDSEGDYLESEHVALSVHPATPALGIRALASLVLIISLSVHRSLRRRK